MVLLVKGDGCDLAADLGRHDLVPAVDAIDQVAAVFGGAGAAEGMGELSIGREVFLYCFCLEGRWSFCQEGDDGGDLADFCGRVNWVMGLTLDK